jgi:hypothetical protein
MGSTDDRASSARVEALLSSCTDSHETDVPHTNINHNNTHKLTEIEVLKIGA